MLRLVGVEGLSYREIVDELALPIGTVMSRLARGRAALLGAVAIVGACFCWGLDNNLTRELRASDPVQIACVKASWRGR